LTDLGKVEADGALWRLVELALEVVQEPRLCFQAGVSGGLRCDSKANWSYQGTALAGHKAAGGTGTF